jgi:hypothetical protein
MPITNAYLPYKTQPQPRLRPRHQTKIDDSSVILLDTKIDEICTGLQPSFNRRLRSVCDDNLKTIVRYVIAMKTETNLSDHYRKDLIVMLSNFSNHNDSNKNKSFEDMTRDDVIAFLDYYRKTETQDPLHKWIGTYNIYRTPSGTILKMVILSGHRT